MNSKSRGYYDPCKKEEEKRRDEEKCRTIIKCSSPRDTTINDNAEGKKFNVARLTLDTSDLKNACVKLEFASNIFNPGNTRVSIDFQVFKKCDHRDRDGDHGIEVGPVWNYTVKNIEELNSTFSFFVCDCDCDCDSCFKDDCCIYTVVATVLDAPGPDKVFIKNATIGAIATCKQNRCHHDSKRDNRY